MSSMFLRAYKKIEAKAAKAGRLVEAKNLLAELKKLMKYTEDFNETFEH